MITHTLLATSNGCLNKSCRCKMFFVAANNKSGSLVSVCLCDLDIECLYWSKLSELYIIMCNTVPSLACKDFASQGSTPSRLGPAQSDPRYQAPCQFEEDEINVPLTVTLSESVFRDKGS